MMWTTFIFLIFSTPVLTSNYLFDFRTLNTVEDWYEVSDTVRTLGSSKATIVLQKTQVFQRAIFFSLLNPLPSGACFAGMKVRKEDFDFSGYSGLLMQCRSQSQNQNSWELVLETNSSNDRFSSYSAFFEVSFIAKYFVLLNLLNFRLMITDLIWKIFSCYSRIFIKELTEQPIRMKFL